jgi:hypothetical protein
LKEDSYPTIMQLAHEDSLSLVIEVIWNSLESERGYSVASLLSCKNHILLLKNAFESVVFKCHRQRVMVTYNRKSSLEMKL